MDSVIIHKPELVLATKINPAAYNPRKIKPREFEALKASIRQNGFVEPLVVRREGMELIGGHQRLRALLDLWKEEGKKPEKVPCTVLDLDARKAKMLNIALNRIMGEFDDPKLAMVIDAIVKEAALTEAEVVSIGMKETEISHYLDMAKGVDNAADDAVAFAQSITLSIPFDTVEERDSVKAILKERATAQKVKMGAILRELLR